ncbi:MAG: radical SAM protein [Lentisphaerae bacterium]|nr:radical SAM protein [Lentisphaerota bacterium]
MSRITELALNARIAFRPRKPILIGRLAQAVLRAQLTSRPFLRYVDFAVDFACNLKCEHCFATSLNQPGRRRMEPADYARVAGEAMALGAVNFSFQGGEPLMHDGLDAIVAACRPNRNLVSVTTNGTLLDDAAMARLKRIGADILTVSLDSSIPEEHDRFRGKEGTFDKAMDGIRRAMRSGFAVNLGTVVTHQSLRSAGITGLVRTAREMKLILYLILPVPAGRWTENEAMMLTGEDLEYIDELTRSTPYVRTDFQANLGPRGCGAVKEILYLTPYGDVLACPFLHIALGNIFDGSLRDIRDRALQNPYFDHYHQKCLVSTDEEFIARHLSKTFDAERLPIPWESGFPRRTRNESVRDGGDRIPRKTSRGPARGRGTRGRCSLPAGSAGVP